MAFRVKVSADAVLALQQLRDRAPSYAGRIVEAQADITKEHYVQNLSGVPFTSETGSHIINKRTGRAVASVQIQYPYGSPYKARLFAAAFTQYASNPERYNYLSILEYGRGPIIPRYTPSALGGNPGGARLAIPGGGHFLVTGQGGFRGATGSYRFVRAIGPMEGKHPLGAAIASSQPEVEAATNEIISEAIAQQ